MERYLSKSKFSNWLVNKKEERIFEISIDNFHHHQGSCLHEKQIINCKCVFENARSQVTDIEISGANADNIISALETSKYYPGQMSRLPNLYLPKNVSVSKMPTEPTKEYFSDIKYSILTQKLPSAVIGMRHILELKWGKEKVFRGDCDSAVVWQGMNYKYRRRAYLKGGEIYDCVQGWGVPDKKVLLSPLTDRMVVRSIRRVYKGSVPKRVVLAPVAFSFLLERILEPNLKGENVINNKLFIKSKDVGKYVFGNIEVVDNPASLHGGDNGLFDFEGCARSPKILISKGSVVNVLMNLSLFKKRKCFEFDEISPGNASSLSETSPSSLEVKFSHNKQMNFEDGLEGFCYITRLIGPHFNPHDGRFTLRCDIPVIFQKKKVYRLPPMIISGNLFEVISNATTSKPFYSGKMRLPFLASKFIKTSMLS